MGGSKVYGGYIHEPLFSKAWFFAAALPCTALSQKGRGVSAKVCQVQTIMPGLCCGAKVQTNT